MSPFLGSTLTIVVGVLLLAGLLTAFGSSQMEYGIVGSTRLGRAQFSPPKGSPADLVKRRARQRADRLFYVGLIATAAGVILQTAAAAWPNSN